MSVKVDSELELTSLLLPFFTNELLASEIDVVVSASAKTLGELAIIPALKAIVAIAAQHHFFPSLYNLKCFFISIIFPFQITFSLNNINHL